MGAGETIVGFDFRPADGLLYALTRDAAKDARLYTLDTVTALAQLHCARIVDMHRDAAA